MKKTIALLLALVLLISSLPLTALAFDTYTVHVGQSGCQLLSLSAQRSRNPWLLHNIPFHEAVAGRAFVSKVEHPNLLGQELIFSFAYEGDSITFNGTPVTSGVTAVTVLAENDIVITAGNRRAEYQVNVTERSNGMPVVLINTNGAPIPDKENYVDATISVIGSDIYGGEDIYSAVAGIKLRGNSTSSFAKKPYRIKFNKKQNVFNLGKAKSWVLLANYLDPAAIRNDVAYAFADRLNKLTADNTGFSMYVPRMRPVEVYLNGELKGLYDMGDHVQVDGTRIDIDESGDELDDNDVQLFPEANVGYYLEIEDSSRVLSEYENEGTDYFTIRNANNDGYVLYVQFKTPEIPSAAQKSYIQNYLQQVNNLIRAENPAVFDMIDVQGFIDWYLVNELFKNTDSAFQSSVKLTKDKDGKLYMGPVWDFDLGAGAVAYGNGEDPTGFYTRGEARCDWYTHLFRMNAFKTAFNERWAKLHEAGVFDALFTDIDNLAAFLKDAADENHTMWHDTYVDEVNRTDWLSVPSMHLTESWYTQIDYFSAFMQARIAWLDTQFGYRTPSSSTLGGKPTVFGKGECGETLTASALSVTPYGASVSYQWYADGVAISGATRSTFTPTAAQIGKAVTVKATGTGRYQGSVTSTPVTIAKTTYTYKTSQIPPIVSVTHDTIVVKERDNYEITVDGEHWQVSGTFTDLEPNTLYTVQYRHGETATQTGGEGGTIVYVITDPASNVVISGDVDRDGDMDTSDVRAVLIALATETPLDESAAKAADYNGDGVVSTADARAILIAIANRETPTIHSTVASTYPPAM